MTVVGIQMESGPGLPGPIQTMQIIVIAVEIWPFEPHFLSRLLRRVFGIAKWRDRHHPKIAHANTGR